MRMRCVWQQQECDWRVMYRLMFGLKPEQIWLTQACILHRGENKWRLLWFPTTLKLQPEIWRRIEGSRVSVPALQQDVTGWGSYSIPSLKNSPKALGQRRSPTKTGSSLAKNLESLPVRPQQAQNRVALISWQEGLFDQGEDCWGKAQHGE